MLYIQHPRTYLPEREYIHQVLLGESLGLEYRSQPHDSQDVSITLAGDSLGHTLIVPDVLFQAPEERWLTESTLPKEPLAWCRVPSLLRAARTLANELPVLYGREVGQGLYSEIKHGATLRLDLFGSAFFMLTRYEELVSPVRDQHNRFPARASLAWREGFLERPLVNEYLELFWAALQRLWPGLERRPRTHRVYLSHDVDRPFCVAGRRPLAVLRSLLADAVLRRDTALARRRMHAWVQARHGILDYDPANTFDFLMDLSERCGRESIFYLMAHIKPHPLDGHYTLEQPWIRGLMRRIHDRGHEIGLHASYLTHLDPKLTCQEFGRLRQAARGEGIEQTNWGGRQHYLRWRNPETWENCSIANLDYDSTLGFTDHVGFRCGLCHEYPVYDLKRRQMLRLRERPLIVMEMALLGQLQRPWPAIGERVLDLDGICQAFGGEFTLLWHNSSLISRQQRQYYRDICMSL